MNEILFRSNIRSEFDGITETLVKQSSDLNKINSRLNQLLKQRRELITSNTIKQDNRNIQQQLSLALEYDQKRRDYDALLRIYELGLQTALSLLHTAVDKYIESESIPLKIQINRMILRLPEVVNKLDHGVTFPMSTTFLLPDYIRARCADQFKLRPLATSLSRLLTSI